MNIIEREIKKREDLIVARTEKLAEADSLEEQAAKIREEYNSLDVEALKAEIEELKSYLSEETPAEPDGVIV